MIEKKHWVIYGGIPKGHKCIEVFLEKFLKVTWVIVLKEIVEGTPGGFAGVSKRVPGWIPEETFVEIPEVILEAILQWIIPKNLPGFPS